MSIAGWMKDLFFFVWPFVSRSKKPQTLKIHLSFYIFLSLTACVLETQPSKTQPSSLRWSVMWIALSPIISKELWIPNHNWQNWQNQWFILLYRCGNAKKDTLSAYCIHRDCSQESDLAANEPICARRLPHDVHGCVKVNLLLLVYTALENPSKNGIVGNLFPKRNIIFV